MKKIILLIVIDLTFTGAFSQKAIGVTGAFNVCNVTPLNTNMRNDIGDIGDYLTGNQNLQYDQDKPVNGVSAGMVFQLAINKFLNLRPALRWIQKGYLYHTFNNNILELNLWDFTYKIQFLELPLDLEYGTPLGGGRAFIGAGPFVSYGLQGTVHEHLHWLNGNLIGGFTYPYSNKDSTHTSSYFGPGSKKFEWGIHSIIGYEFSFGAFVSVEYELSLKSIFNTSNNQKLSLFQFGVGYMIKKW
jgi:hypothetical protein